MGQKVNPIIFRITNTSWVSKYFEKKPTEFSIYTKQDIEIRNFISKLFGKNKMKVHNCNISYLGRSIHIFITYFRKWKIKSLKNKNNKNQKTKNKIKWIQKHKSKIENYLSKSESNLSKTKLSIKRFFEIEQMKCFLEQLFESVALFTRKNNKIFLILQKLNHQGKSLRNFLGLRKYRRETYSVKVVQSFFACGINETSAEQLSSLVAFTLKKLKRHNRFFKYLKAMLCAMKKSRFTVFEGIKVKIKGRINRRPRAKSKTISIGKDISTFKISSRISYGEASSFTKNGTLGVKVWIQKPSII